MYSTEPSKQLVGDRVSLILLPSVRSGAVGYVTLKQRGMRTCRYSTSNDQDLCNLSPNVAQSRKAAEPFHWVMHGGGASPV